MGCIISIIGFALGFAFFFWGFSIAHEILPEWALGEPLPWWAKWPASIIGGIAVAGMLNSTIEKAQKDVQREREDEVIRRAQVKQAEEYLASRDGDPDSNSDENERLY